MPATRTRAKKIPKFSATLMWGAAALTFLILVIKNSALAASLTLSALRVCATTLIPALFPSAVAARILAESGALLPLATPLDRISRPVFGLGGEALAVAVTGIVCGFPTGAVGAMSLYKGGRLSDGQLLRVCLLSGTPSLSFLVFAVGERGFGDRRVGFFIFFSALFSSASLTFILSLFDRKKCVFRKYPPFADDFGKKVPQDPPCGVGIFTTAVSASALDILKVSAFVVFFSVLSGFAQQALSFFVSSPHILVILGCLEITGGMIRAASLSLPLGAPFAAFFAGFGGLCAAAQVASIIRDSKADLSLYLLLRLLSGLLSAFIFNFFIFFCGKP